MKLTKEVRDRITKHQEMLRVGLHYMECAQTYKKRSGIKLTDLELNEFIAIVKSEIMLVPIDAFLIDAFLEREDERRKKRSRWMRLTRAWKGKDFELRTEYQRFVQAAKLALYPEGKHIKMKEEIDEEAVAAREAIQDHGKRR